MQINMSLIQDSANSRCEFILLYKFFISRLNITMMMNRMDYSDHKVAIMLTGRWWCHVLPKCLYPAKTT
jgi:hypothetical protein